MEMQLAAAQVSASSLRGGLEIEIEIVVRDRDGLANEVLEGILQEVNAIIETESRAELMAAVRGF
jgi:hypothetical protein